MNKIDPAFIKVITDNITEIKETAENIPDWKYAANKFNPFFNKMANPTDLLWSFEMMKELWETYYKARDNDKSYTNITLRTVKAMPKERQNDTKKIFLQIADICRIFHAGHKANFEPDELPQDIEEIIMVPAKKKGFFTFAEEMPSLYKKISLTFDYWVPKILDWTEEIREKGLKEWKGEAIQKHETCTDFMRIALIFLSAPETNLPIAKSDVREKILKNIFYEDFIWIKKSQKREDILTNSEKLKSCLDQLSTEVNMQISYEAWTRLLNLKYIKAFIN
jgi:hypothetical protein